MNNPFKVITLSKFQYSSIKGENCDANNWDENKKEQSWITIGQTNINVKINIFNDIFLCKNIQNGNDQAIALMDIQGLSNYDSSQNYIARFFTFANLISSTIFVISNGIGEFELQYLRTSIDYNKFIISKNLEAPDYFATKTVFLISDAKAKTFENGPESGEKYLKNALENDKTIEEADFDDYAGFFLFVIHMSTRFNYDEFHSFLKIIFEEMFMVQKLPKLPEKYCNLASQGSEFVNLILENLKLFEEPTAYTDKHELFKMLFERTETFLHDPKVEKKLNSIDNTCVERYGGTSYKISDKNIILDNFKNCKPGISGKLNFSSSNIEIDGESESESENEKEEASRQFVNPKNLTNNKEILKNIFENSKKRRIVNSNFETSEENLGEKLAKTTAIEGKDEKFYFHIPRSVRFGFIEEKQGEFYFKNYCKKEKLELLEHR